MTHFHTPQGSELRTSPTTPLVEPLVIRQPFERHGAELWIDWDDDDNECEWRPLPAEVAIRELVDLDVMDDEAVCGFLATYGLVLDSRNDDSESLHIGEARHRLAQMRTASRHALAAAIGADVVVPWNEWFDLEGMPDPLRFEPVQGLTEANARALWTEDEDSAWGWFAVLVNQRLRDVGPRIEYKPAAWDGEETFVGERTSDLSTALAVQIFNFVAEGLPVRQCANETCGRSFVRQRGTAKQGQYRTTGVIYCTNQCARAQAKREARRRAAQARSTDTQDTTKGSAR